jgi:two-component sensor histidine kinase
VAPEQGPSDRAAPIEGPAPPVLFLAPLASDARALTRLLDRRGLSVAAFDRAETFAAALSAGAERTLFVVVTHEAAGEATGRALDAVYDAEPAWSNLPAVFLVKDPERPPPACRLLARRRGQPPLVLLRRPVPAATLDGVFGVQAEVRRRQFETRDLLAELEEAESRQRFLLAELRHRTRNSMAVLQAMFRLTAAQHTDLDSFAGVFSERLEALSAAQGRLSGGGPQDRDLARLLRDHVAPYCSDPRCLLLDGPRVRLSRRMAFDLAMVVHELATNAAKYGALSVPAGRVRVGWAPDAETAGLRLTWQESDGPEVVPPARRGLGSQLIESLAGGTGATSAVDYRPDGLLWTAEIPVEHWEAVAADREG